jgi:chromosome segregation ATPase
MVNRRGAPFRDASQVESHIDGSHDAAHRDERGEDHREKIEENAEEVEESEMDGSDPPEPDDGSDSLDELRQRVDDLDERTKVPMGLDTLGELNDAHQDRHDVIEERVEELENRVDEHEAVLYELLETVEILGAAADANDVDAARVTVANEGSDGYPWTWDTETLDFKAERFE